MEDLILEAKRKGHAYTKFEDEIIYFCVKMENRKKEIDKVLEKIFTQELKDEDTISIGSLACAFEYLKLYRPVTTFRLDKWLIYDIIFHRIQFCTILNLGSVATSLKNMDFPSKIGEGEIIMMIDDVEVRITNRLLGRILYELESMESFYNMAKELLPTSVKFIKEAYGKK